MLHRIVRILVTIVIMVGAIGSAIVPAVTPSSTAFADVLPPMSFAASADGYPTMSVNNLQRASYYTVGLHWLFYQSSTYTISYKTSQGGITWSAPTELTSVYGGWTFTSFLDNSGYIHYTAVDYLGTLHYRRGLLNSDGTITWSAVEQTVTTSANTTTVGGPTPSSIAVDATGHAYIAYRTSPNGYLSIVSNNSTDGTWVQRDTQEMIAAINGTAQLVPLDDGTVYAVYGVHSAKLHGRLYNAGWGAEEEVTDEICDTSWSYSAVDNGGEVEVVYDAQIGANDLRSVTRSAVGVWTEVVIGTTVGGALIAPCLSKIASGDLVVFYGIGVNTANIYYSRRTTGAWGAIATWFTDTSNILDNDWSTSFYEESSGMVGYVYVTGYWEMANGYADVRIKYAIMNTTPLPTLTLYPSGTSDGHAYRSGTDETWANLLAGAGTGESNTTTNAALWAAQCTTTANHYTWLTRGQIFIDTSSIPDTANVTAATLSVYGHSKADTAGWLPSIGLYGSTSANVTVSRTDLQAVTNTALSDTVIAYNDFSTAGYNNYALNTTGKAYISLNGWTRFSFRDTKYDITGTPPTWVSGSWNQSVQYKTSETALTTQDPKLVITYDYPGAATTGTATAKSTTEGIISGSITDIVEGRLATSRGFEWGTAPGVYTDNYTETGYFDVGTFTHTITGLVGATTYYYRVKASNGATWYGAEESFTTATLLPTTFPISIDANTDYETGLGSTIQRRIYFTAGRHWMVYPSYTPSNPADYDIHILTSTDGTYDWTTVTTGLIADSTMRWKDTADISTTFDGTYLHIAWRTFDNRLMYRRTTLNADGSLTWSSATQVVTTGLSSLVNYPGNPGSISVDTTGHAFITYADSTNHVTVISNSNTDGTWSTSTGFPYVLDTGNTGVKAQSVALSSGGVYFTYVAYSDRIRGRLWDGTAWGPTVESVSSEYMEIGTGDNATGAYYMYSMVAHGDIIEVVYHAATSNTFRCATRSAAGVWAEVETIVNTFTSPIPPVLSLWGASDLRVFYVATNTLYYFGRTAGAWDIAPTSLSDETANTIYKPTMELSASYVSNAAVGAIGIAYVTGTSPYSLRYFVMSDVAVTTGAATGVSSTGLTLNGTIISVSGAVASDRGFEFGWTSGVYQCTWSESGGFSVGDFSHALTGYFAGESFYEGETVYYRAFATTAEGVIRGGEQTTGTISSPVTYPFDMALEVTQTTPTAHDMASYITAINNPGLANISIMLDTTRDTNVVGVSQFPHMTTDNATLFSMELPAVNKYNVNYLSGQTPADLSIIAGEGGYLTTADNASLELSDNFTVLMSLYVDSAATDNYTRKTNSISIANTTGDITAAITGGASVTAANITDGLHVIKVIADTTDLLIYVDDVLCDSAALGGVGVPDTANSYVWLEGTPYASYLAIKIDDSWKLWYQPRLMITGTTLPDRMSITDGAFTFGTCPTGTTVEIASIGSMAAPAAPATTAVAPWELIDETPTQPSGLFDDGGEGMLGLDELGDASEATGNPREMFSILLAFILAALAGIAVFGYTHNSKVGQRGSLLLQSLTSLIVMIFFYVGGGGVIPGWVLIPFGLEAIFWLITRNPQHSST